MTPKVLFVNSEEPQCGVHQYGLNLFWLLEKSKRYFVDYNTPVSRKDLQERCEAFRPDAIVYNWAPAIGGWLADIPFTRLARHHLAVYHDGHIAHEKLDAILFSDPTMPQHSNWYPIGRPLPQWDPLEQSDRLKPRIGVNGFMGAWAILAVRQILHEFPNCVLRLHLPAAHFGDPSGVRAEEQLQACMALSTLRPDVTVEVQREFLTTNALLEWLSKNDLNVYVRDLPPTWRGISSVLDPALAVRRPIAVNLCTAFRHVHNLNPSICIEHNDLRTILKNGTKPLRPLYDDWSPERVRGQVEDVLDKVFAVETKANGE